MISLEFSLASVNSSGGEYVSFSLRLQRCSHHQDVAVCIGSKRMSKVIFCSTRHGWKRRAFVVSFSNSQEIKGRTLTKVHNFPVWSQGNWMALSGGWSLVKVFSGRNKGLGILSVWLHGMIFQWHSLYPLSNILFSCSLCNCEVLELVNFGGGS
uniref:Uncharacterized protein n=1 Tax=Cucumis melo TaxID=3656 RepID=A0A9I9E9L6_CUCME